MEHIPVLLDEVIEGLNPRPGGLYIDGTLGAGGHTAALLAHDPALRVLGFDRDAGALAQTRALLDDPRLETVHASFVRMGALAPPRGFGQVDGILLDLGFSSMQVDDPARGFSFRADGPLDMRMDRSRGVTAAELVNTLGEGELADLIYQYGEDRYARRIARALVQRRPFSRTLELAEAVRTATPPSREKIDPATRTFQALRIAVNEELDALEAVLPQALDLLKPGGRLAVISFHSLEDRIVKHFMRDAARDCICPPELPICVCDTVPTVEVLTRKPITASEDEVARNPRARSAKLRLAERAG